MKSIPKRVYKYRNWIEDDHKNVLKKNELFLASPISFDDPFDCRIPPNFSLLDENEKENYINDLLIKQVGLNLNIDIDFNKAIPEFENRMKNISRVQKDYEKEFFQNQDLYFGVLCLSRLWDSISMWSLYANANKGICLGFFEELLRKSINNNKSACKRVKYDNNFPKIKPIVIKNEYDPEIIKRMFIQYFWKSKEWKNEKEYRIISNFYPKVPEKDDRIIRFPNKAFSEVILGINFPESKKEEIIDICKSKKVRLYQASKADFKFKILRKQIK